MNASYHPEDSDLLVSVHFEARDFELPHLLFGSLLLSKHSWVPREDGGNWALPLWLWFFRETAKERMLNALCSCLWCSSSYILLWSLRLLSSCRLSTQHTNGPNHNVCTGHVVFPHGIGKRSRPVWIQGGFHSRPSFFCGPGSRISLSIVLLHAATKASIRAFPDQILCPCFSPTYRI